MLRVGLTGGLGSGKSTAGRMFAERGAFLLQSDEIGRELMQPGQAVYEAVVAQFGARVVRADGSLDRRALAQLAFEQGGEEALSAIVHPAVIAEQEHRMATIAVEQPEAIVIVESALIFETAHGGPNGWRDRFDRLILVTAPDEVKVARFLGRSGATPDTAASLEAEARRRLALQMPDAKKIAHCDYILHNDVGLSLLAQGVSTIWAALRQSGPARQKPTIRL